MASSPFAENSSLTRPPRMVPRRRPHVGIGAFAVDRVEADVGQHQGPGSWGAPGRGRGRGRTGIRRPPGRPSRAGRRAPAPRRHHADAFDAFLVRGAGRLARCYRLLGARRRGARKRAQREPPRPRVNASACERHRNSDHFAPTTLFAALHQRAWLLTASSEVVAQGGPRAAHRTVGEGGNPVLTSRACTPSAGNDDRAQAEPEARARARLPAAAAPAEVASAELAGYMADCRARCIVRSASWSADGRDQHVFVGDASRITPRAGPYPRRRGRFRGLRLVHTHLRNEPLTRDDWPTWRCCASTWSAIGVATGGRPTAVHRPPAARWPGASGRGACCRPSRPPRRADFVQLIAGLEAQYGRGRQPPPPIGKDKALLVHVCGMGKVEAGRRSDGPDRRAAGAVPDRRRARGRRHGAAPPPGRPKFLVGRGKLEDVLLRAMQLDAEMLIFDRDLTPVQAHAIAEVTDLKVLDRTQLILDIFAQRARAETASCRSSSRSCATRCRACVEKNTMMSRADRRHRRPRPRRDQARDQPPSRPRAHPPAREASSSALGGSAPAPLGARASAGCRSWPSSATPTPARGRCSTR